MSVADKFTGPAFDAAMKKGVKKDSHYSLNKCTNARSRVLATLGIPQTDVVNNTAAYLELQNKVCDYAKSL